MWAAAAEESMLSAVTWAVRSSSGRTAFLIEDLYLSLPRCFHRLTNFVNLGIGSRLTRCMNSITNRSTGAAVELPIQNNIAARITLPLCFGEYRDIQGVECRFTISTESQQFSMKPNC